MNALKACLVFLSFAVVCHADTELSAWMKPGRTDAVKVPKRGYLQEPKAYTVARPVPLKTVEEFKRINPLLPTVLPGLSDLLASAKVSPKFDDLYDRKVKRLAKNLMSDEEFFDCATVLHLTAEKGRHVVLLQSDMDVVTDGSDPDRLARLEQYDAGLLDNNFQPLVGYFWAGKPGQTNPFLDFYPREIAAVNAFTAQVNAMIQGLPEQKIAGDHCFAWRRLLACCKSQSEELTDLYRKHAKDMNGGHSLIAETDPFVVVPGAWVPKDESKAAAAGDPFQIYLGDYVAVIHKGVVYPAIVGDTGPEHKTGEASLKIARAIRPSASGNLGAVNGVGVTYLIFPGTHDPRSKPDLDHFRVQVQKYLSEIGGLGGELHKW